MGKIVKYCLDTNVFLESFKRYYSFSIAPPFWDALVDWGNQGTVQSLNIVYDELVKGDQDELVDWVKNTGRSIFQEPDISTYDEYTKIADLVVRDYEPHVVEPFLKGADPWVIAHAKANNYTVITLEGFRQEQRNPSGHFGCRKVAIPNICKKIGVSVTDTFQFLSNIGFSFH